jgi:hypothetical protein
MIQAYGDLCNICVNIEADEHGVVDANMCDLVSILTLTLTPTLTHTPKT